MAYTKTTWINNSAPYLNATNLNKIEDGIFNNDAVLNNKADVTYVDSENTAQDNAIALKLDIDNPTFTGNLTGQFAFFDSIYLNTWTVSGTELGNFTIGRQGSTGKIQIQPNAPLLTLTDSNGLQWDGKIVAIAEDVEPSLGNPAENGYFLSSQTDGTRSWIDLSTGGTTAAWGSISGTLSDQTDLDNALFAKLPTEDPVFTGRLGGPEINCTETRVGGGMTFKALDGSVKLVNYNSDSIVHMDIATDSLPLAMTSTGITYDSKNVVVEDAYATDTVGGTIKIAVVGTDCYITTDGSTPGA